MKKLFTLLVLGFAATLTAFAQQTEPPFNTFPTEKGDKMVYATYDAAGKLVATTKYTIIDHYVYNAEEQLNIYYILEDAQNAVIDEGNFSAHYGINYNLNLNMPKTAIIPVVETLLSSKTQMLGTLFDYPDPMGLGVGEGRFQTSAGSMILKSKYNTTDYAIIRMHFRDYKGKEQIKVPAGSYEASKITFQVEVYSNYFEQKAEYEGVEWFAFGAGVVRSEIRDMNGNLVNFTVLTEIKE